MDDDGIRQLLAPLGSGAIGLGLVYLLFRVGYSIVEKTLKLVAFAMLTFLTFFAVAATYVAWRVLRYPEALKALQDGEWMRALMP